MAEPVEPVAVESFFACSPEMLFIAKRDGTLVRWSDAMDTAFGAQLSQTAQLSVLVHPDDRQSFLDAWSGLKGGDGHAQMECRIRDGQGAYRRLVCKLRSAPAAGVIHGSLQAPPVPEAGERPDLPEQLLRALLDHMNISLWALDGDGNYIFQGGKGLSAVGLRAGEFLGKNFFDLFKGDPVAIGNVRRVLSGEPVHATIEAFGAYWENWVIPAQREAEAGASVIGFSLDVSEAKRVENELRSKLELIEKQQRVIRDLSTPIIEVWHGVLTLPMVGVVDSLRTAEVMDSLLNRVVSSQARFAILDLTGVEVVDTKVASHIIDLVSAIRLLGAEGIVTGIKPTVAQTMVALGLDLSKVVTRGNLRAGLTYCIQRMAAMDQAPAKAPT